MSRSILKINITNELDVVLAYKRAMQLSERLGMAQANQTKFATAVSEICRNVVEHVGNGGIHFSLAEEGGVNYLEASITDRGRGIGNLEYILSGRGSSPNGRGSGIVNSRKLTDFFDIESDFEKGTRVTLRKKLPAQAPNMTKQLLENWTMEFDQETRISPYAEIKRQNMQLLELLEQLHLRNIEAEQQLQEIRRLNTRLQQSNSEIGMLLEERDKKNSQLQHINQSLDAFAHTVSHDLRAPLQNINGITLALEAYLEAEQLEEANHVFPMLRQQTHKMDRLITGILAYSLAGRRNIQKNAVNLYTLLHQVVASLDVPAGCDVCIPEDLPVLYTEEIFLYQVFSNIIGNSIKHHDQPDKGSIKIACELNPEFLSFSVQDNGPGIPQKKQHQVLSIHELDTSVRRSLSSGLGLSIVSKIIDRKGCKLWIESEGRGSRFVFTWPATELMPEDFS
ncbi:sensor histidine kinase [Pontibacter pamirensis]|uniref:sensor histidine kinase n=1 Tax=Pontibacter pamirensis TaxID=2562824 RepID=UPI0013895180|nr:sensor histidine kinase [Pontibacter pamirensis]